ncbi:pfh1 [Symbiodinium microadriaticum]|nr:pfh1 [Symbiodinium sp. KB8]CAE7459459.1 pfh1 [Symbiodinium microadriaticum]
MLSAALTRNSSMPSSRRWADITDDDDSEEVYVWDWEAFKREYLATHCRLTLMTPVCASVCLLATCDWAPHAAPLAPEAGAIVIDEARATVNANRYSVKSLCHLRSQGLEEAAARVCNKAGRARKTGRKSAKEGALAKSSARHMSPPSVPIRKTCRLQAKVPTPQKRPQPGVSSEEDEVLNAAFQRAEVQVPVPGASFGKPR